MFSIGEFERSWASNPISALKSPNSETKKYRFWASIKLNRLKLNPPGNFKDLSHCRNDRNEEETFLILKEQANDDWHLKLKLEPGLARGLLRGF